MAMYGRKVRVKGTEKGLSTSKRTVSPGSKIIVTTSGAKVSKSRSARTLYATYQYLYEQDSKDLDAAIYTLRRLKKA